MINDFVTWRGISNDEIEQFYIDAADDFRLLNESAAMARLDHGPNLYFGNPKTKGSGWYSQLGDDIRYVHSHLAVAVMTECWRQELEKKHNYTLACTVGGQWCTFDDDCRPWKVWNSLAEAICGTVKILAAKKRAASHVKPTSWTCRGRLLDYADDTATENLWNDIDCLWAEVRRINHNLNLPPMAHMEIKGIRKDAQ